MDLGIHEQASKTSKEYCNTEVSDRGLWAAVLLQALEDWQSSNARRQREAESFFFESEEDFAIVCRGAGLNAASVLGKLREMKKAPRRSYDAALPSRNVELPVGIAA